VSASCLFSDFALFYAQLTSAGSLDSVTSLVNAASPELVVPPVELFVRMAGNEVVLIKLGEPDTGLFEQ